MDFVVARGVWITRHVCEEFDGGANGARGFEDFQRGHCFFFLRERAYIKV